MIFKSFKSRSYETERLDRGEFSEAEYRRWQKEMWYIHRFFGEVRALRNTLVAEIKQTKENSLSVLEIAAGSGGLLAYLNEQVHQKRLTRIGLEMSANSASLIAKNGSIAVRGNGLELPFVDKSVDFAFSTLFLHHLDETNARQLIREMQRVVRRKFFIIDLDRRALPYLLYRSFGTLLLQRFTLNDGALSIRRAYRASELERIADSAGLKRFTISTSAINRLVLSADG